MGSLIRLPERSTNRTEAYFDTSAETAPRPEAIRKLPASISEQLVAATQTGNVLNQIIDAVQRHIDFLDRIAAKIDGGEERESLRHRLSSLSELLSQRSTKLQASIDTLRDLRQTHNS
jgi:hypothetical protein